MSYVEELANHCSVLEQQLAAAQAAVLHALSVLPWPEHRPQWGTDDYKEIVRVARVFLAEQPTDALRAFVIGLLPDSLAFVDRKRIVDNLEKALKVSRD